MCASSVLHSSYTLSTWYSVDIKPKSVLHFRILKFSFWCIGYFFYQVIILLYNPFHLRKPHCSVVLHHFSYFSLFFIVFLFFIFLIVYRFTYNPFHLWKPHGSVVCSSPKLLHLRHNILTRLKIQNIKHSPEIKI